MKMRKTHTVALLAVLVLPGSAHAKKNDPNIELAFTPTQTVAAVEVDVGPLVGTPVRLEVEDARPVEDDSKLGTRTDDDDERYTLRAIGSVVEFVDESLLEQAASWGLVIDEEAEQMLSIRINSLQITETNQAVGATYRAEVRLGWTFEVDGSEAASGSAFGDATRWGKKFSTANTNEVLSDALLEAFGEVLSDSQLRSAWRSGR